MNRREKVDLFEQIRRGHAAGESILSLANKHGIHRRMVRQALASAIPPERKRQQRKQPKIEPVKGFIDHILAEDVEGPRKQRHTARRIWSRLQKEYPQHPVAESTVRQYVRAAKRALGQTPRELYVPQTYKPGQEAQVDWFEAQVKLGGEACRLHFFAMRSMASGGAFHRAYTNATQQAFLEAHEHAFDYFGGVFHTLRYDNLGAAVKKILRGYRREETERMIAFRSHWGFQSEYCNPARGNEKGGVENELGWFRRNWLVPVPEARDLDSFNQWLLTKCYEIGKHRLSGRNQTIGEAMEAEQSSLLPLNHERFPVAEVLFPVVVDNQGRVKVKANWYSAPLWPGNRAEAWVWPARIDIRWCGQLVASHQRCYGRGHQLLELEHYLDVLEIKPGAMRRATALEQWRAKGLWPECMDRFYARLEQRYGRRRATQEMISLIRTGTSERQWSDMIAAVEEGLRLGVGDAAAIVHIFRVPDAEQRRQQAMLLADELRQFERPMPVMDDYDALLSATAVIQ